jgi:hypothetical protein
MQHIYMQFGGGAGGVPGMRGMQEEVQPLPPPAVSFILGGEGLPLYLY